MPISSRQTADVRTLHPLISSQSMLLLEYGLLSCEQEVGESRNPPVLLAKASSCWGVEAIWLAGAEWCSSEATILFPVGLVPVTPTTCATTSSRQRQFRTMKPTADFLHQPTDPAALARWK